MEPPVVLVTGCSSGIGHEAALELAKRGARVVATARRPGDLDALASRSPLIQPMHLDVTDEAGRRRVVDAVLSTYGRVDALVNNAGYGAHLAVEETPEDMLRAMLETNLVAPHALARLVLPPMRQQALQRGDGGVGPGGRHVAGRIINVSSIAGHVPVPMMGAYCATKFALRALTHALHVEVRHQGIHACLVEPGIIRTAFGQRSHRETQAAVPHASTGPYAAWHARWQARRQRRKGADAAVVARAIAHACLAPRPRFHYFTPMHARAANLAKRVMPDAWLNAGYRMVFQTARM